MITAKEARRKTEDKILHLASIEMDKIKQLIENAIEDCQCSVSQNGELSQGCRNQLESLGYKVETGNQYNQPWYCIRW